MWMSFCYLVVLQFCAFYLTLRFISISSLCRIEALGLHLFVAWFQSPCCIDDLISTVFSWFLIENEKMESHCLCWRRLSLPLVSVLCPGLYLIALSSFLWFSSWAVWVLQVCSSISHACSLSVAFWRIVSLCGCYMYVCMQVDIQPCMESSAQCSIFSSITLYLCFLRHSLSEPEASIFLG